MVSIKRCAKERQNSWPVLHRYECMNLVEVLTKISGRHVALGWRSERLCLPPWLVDDGPLFSRIKKYVEG